MSGTIIEDFGGGVRDSITEGALEFSTPHHPQAGFNSLSVVSMVFLKFLPYTPRRAQKLPLF